MTVEDMMRMNRELEELRTRILRKQGERESLSQQATVLEAELRRQGFDVDNLDTSIQNLYMELNSATEEAKKRLATLGISLHGIAHSQ